MTLFGKVGRDGACVPALRRLGYGVSLLALSAALPAFAQEAATTEPVDGELPTVTVDSGAQFVGDPFTTPSAVSVVGQDELDIFGGVRIDNILRSVPGTFTRDSTSNPGIAVNIRGFEGSGRVNMMIDGVRQNFRFVGHEAAGFTYVDPALLAGIDIARGAVSTVGGAGSLVGLANFRTIGVDDIIKPGNTLGALGSVSWGSNNLDWSEMIAGAARISDNAAVAGAVSHSGPGSYKNGDGQTVPNTGEDLTSGLIKADFKPTEDSTLKLGAVFYNNDFVSNSYDQNVKNNTFTLNYTYDPASELINFRFNTYYNDLTMKYLNYAVYSPPPASSQAGRTIEDKGWGFDTTNISLFSTGAVNIIAEYGFEFFADDVNTFNTENSSLGGGVNPSGNSTVGGAFSQTTFRYNIVDLIIGLRYDFFTLEGSGEEDAAGGQVPIGPWSVDRSEGRFDPKITLAVNPYDWLQVYGLYAEAMRAPTISETMVGGNHPGGGGNYSPNPYLEPEIQKGWEFGANIRKDSVFIANDVLRLKGDYYYMDVENYITACFGAQTYFCNVPGTSQVDGFEFEGMYDAGFAFAGISYTYTHTDLPTQTPGFGASQYLPDNVFTFTAGARFLERRLTVGGRYFVASEGKTATFSGVENTDGYELLDLYTTYDFQNGVQLALNVSNVFDVDYTPALSTAQSGSLPAFTGDTGMGRTFLVTMRAHF